MTVCDQQVTANKAGAVIRPGADVQEGVVMKEDAAEMLTAAKRLAVDLASCVACWRAWVRA